MRWIFVAVLTLTAVPAAAQLPYVSVGGFMSPTLNTPDSSTFNCSTTSSTCHPLNASQCNDQSDTTGINRTVHVNLPATTGWLGMQTAVAPGISQLIVWVQQAGTAPTSQLAAPNCTLPAGAAPSSPTYPIIATHTLIAGQWPFNGNSIVFPDALNDGTLGTTGNVKLTMGDFINATGALSSGTQVKNACSTPLGLTYYVLCFGIDTYGSSGTGQVVADGGITPTSEPTGWVIFTVDTQPPAAVTAVSFDELPGEVTVTPTAAGKVAGDQWNVKIRPLPTGQEPTTDKCINWTGVTESATADAISQSSLTLAATNGVTYEGCVDLLDELGNEGTDSASFTFTTFDQCDYASCYPGNQLKTGFCAAVAPAPFAAVALALLLRRFKRRQRVRS